MTRVPLNLFQSTMRLWDAYHPYNAAQVMHLEICPPQPLLQDAWLATLRTLGLGYVVTDGRTYGFHPAGATAITTHVRQIGEGAADDAEADFEAKTQTRATATAVTPDITADNDTNAADSANAAGRSDSGDRHGAGNTTGRLATQPRLADACGQVAPIERLMRHLSAEIDRPFNSTGGTTQPFRPFVVYGHGQCYVGLVYQHWVADSVSIRLLMREWLLRIGSRAGAMERPVRLARRGLLHHFGPGAAGWSLPGQVMDTLAFASAVRTVRRLPQSATDSPQRVLYRRLPDGMIADLKRFGRACGATIGDLFSAAAVDVAHRLGPTIATTRRPDIAFGSIVDLRARSAAVPDDVFGLFLGFVTSIYPAGVLDPFDRLLHAVVRQHRAARRRKLAEAGQVRMAIGLGVSRFVTDEKMLNFYRRRFPLAGGLSSVNLNGQWQADHHPGPLLQYLRVSPTGPLMPLAFTPTTLGDTLHVCCTVRTHALPGPAADAIVDAFVARLGACAAGQS